MFCGCMGYQCRCPAPVPLRQLPGPYATEFLYAWEREQHALAKQALTAAWAYGSALDQNEQARMERVAAGAA